MGEIGIQHQRGRWGEKGRCETSEGCSCFLGGGRVSEWRLWGGEVRMVESYPALRSKMTRKRAARGGRSVDESGRERVEEVRSVGEVISEGWAGAGEGADSGEACLGCESLR